MSQRISLSNKGQKVSVIRDFPHGCNTQSALKNQRSGIVSDDIAVIGETRENLYACEDNRRAGAADLNYHRPKEAESFDLLLRKAGFNMAANGNVGNGKSVPAKRKFLPSCASKVKPLSSEETIALIASERRRRRRRQLSGNIQRKPLLARVVQKQRNSPEKNKLSHAAALRLKASAHKLTLHSDKRRSILRGLIPVIQQNRITEARSPREKVLKALQLFKLVFEKLDRDKAARRGESKTATSRIDYDTRTVLMEMKMLVNNQKMIGPVPGVQVGDKFQFKSELNIIGLHFFIMGGIDYMKRGDMILATSIVSSEGNGYSDRFGDDVMIYCGQGGNLTSTDRKLIEDQKLVTGNLALANSMREKTPVRVIRGKRRPEDQRGKDYVYVGLYLVEEYWREKGPLGNILIKFKLRKVSGQR